jgi:hypothetical protein
MLTIVLIPLCGVGLQDAWDTTIETFKAIEHPISKIVQIVVEVCMFAAQAMSLSY